MPDSVAETRDLDKRGRILRAARSVCERWGFDAARMEEIAAEAQVSKGTLYRFFSSKEDLLLATLLDSDADAERFAGVGPTGPAGTRLERLLEGYLAVLPHVSRQMLGNLQAWGVVARDQALQRRFYKALKRVYAERSRELAEALHEGMAAGVYRRDVDVETMVSTLLALLDGVLYRSTFDPDHAGTAQLSASFEVLLAPLRTAVPDASGESSVEGD